LRKIIVAYITRREYLISEGGFEKNALLNLTKNLITYGIVQPGPEVPNGVPYIQSSDIKNSEISRDLSKTSNEIAQSYSRSDVVPGDVIFSLRGNLGDTAIVPSDFGKTNMARGVARISLNEDCDNLYIKYALETKPVLGKILAVSQGSTFKEVSLDTLRKIKVPVPEGLERQIEISSILKLMVKTKSLQESKISISQSLQKSLINQVF
jgi:type I restriction enzyme S subunit